jgi:hypothetical protein
MIDIPGRQVLRRSALGNLVLACLVVLLCPPSPLTGQVQSGLAARLPLRAAVTAGPTIALSLNAGPPGTTILVSGGGFPPSTPLVISYAEPRTDATPAVLLLASVVSGSDGTVSPTTVTIPALATPGSLGLVTIGLAPGELHTAPQSPGIASTPFAVTPLLEDLSASSSTVYPGGSLTIGGAGFPAQEAVTVGGFDAAGNVLVNSTPLTATTSGVLQPLVVSVPVTATSGVAVIDAYDTSGMAAGMPITILPASQAAAGSLRLQPVRVSPGGLVQLTATGLQPGELVAVTLQGASGTSTSVPGVSDLVADATGLLQGSFVLPATAGITQVLGAGGDNLGTLLNVSVRGAQSGITLSAPLLVAATRLTAMPATAVPGQAVSLQGFGFAAQEEVTVTLADSTGSISQIGRVAAGADGSFSLPTTAPALNTPDGQPATFLLTATGETSGLVATYTLVVHGAPTLSLQPYVAAPGQTVQLQGTGFIPNATTAITASFTLTTSRGSHPQHFLAATDANGAFTAALTVPGAARLGPVAIQAGDAHGDNAAILLTVNNQSPMLRVTPFSARPGQTLNVQGSGFAADEHIDVYLAVPASHPSALPGTTVTVSADMHGNFSLAFVLPGGATGTAAFPSGSYLLVASGEASGRAAINAFVMAAPAGTPLPTATPPPAGSTPAPVSPTPIPCGTGTGGQIDAATQQAVLYLASVPTDQSATGAGTGIATQADLQILNDGDAQVAVTVAYLIYPPAGNGSPSVRTVLLAIPPHSMQLRSVNEDAGSGHQVGIIVRVDSVAATGCPSPAPPCAAGPCTTVRASLVFYRSRRSTAGGRQTQEILDVGSVSGAPLDAGADQPRLSSAWFFAEGYSGAGFQEYLDLLNPQNARVQVHVDLVTASGPVKQGLSISLLPLEQKRIDVHAAYQQLLACHPPAQVTACGAAAPATGLALIVHSDLPVMASRALYWGSGGGSSKAGFDVGSGSTSAARQLAFAYASTVDGDTAFLSLLYPASCGASARGKACPAAQVVAHVFTASGLQVATARLSLGANRRGSLALNGLVDQGIYAVVLQSTQPIVAEIVQYVGGTPSKIPVVPGLDLQGVPAGTSLLSSALDDSADPLVHVYNPSAGHMVVRLSAMSTGGAYVTRTYQIAPDASLEAQVPTPAGLRFAGSHQPIGISISCSSPCVAAALEGVHRLTGGGQTDLPGEAWGESLR